ncbi:MAG: hypothetical protein C3F12_14195 [Candidatus Methylomirabilota bacterium]|nr:MAG: hypothetical protein C3F12_14195 [candidate division NC10 bacterium]
MGCGVWDGRRPRFYAVCSSLCLTIMLLTFLPVLLLLAPLQAAASPEATAAPLWREALDLIETNNDQSAIPLLDDLRHREGFSRAPEAHFLLGMALYRQKRWQEAADALETAATRLPLLGDYALHYGASAYRTLRLTAQAAASLSRLLRDYPESLLAERARQERAALYLDAGQLAEAEEAHRDYLAHTSGEIRRREAQLALAEIAVKTDRPRQAEAFLRELWLKWPGTREAARADELLTSMAEVPPFTADEQFERALNLHRSGQYAQAITAFAPFLTDGSGFASRARLWSGIGYFHRRDYSRAVGLLSPLSQDRSLHSAEALYWIGRSYAKVDDREKAAATWARLVDAYPHSPFAAESLYLMALEHSDNGQPKPAIRALNRLLRDHPSSRFVDAALWTRAWIQYRRSAFTKALADLRQLHARGTADPRFQVQALYWQGRALEGLKRRGKAVETYRRLLRAHVDDDYYAEQTRLRLKALGAKVVLPAVNTREAGGGRRGTEMPVPCTLSPQPCSSETAKARLLKELKLRAEASDEFRALAARYTDDRGVLYEACSALLDLGQFDKSVWIAKRFLRPLYVRSRPMEPMPRYWEFLYPLGYWELIQGQSARHALDPFLVIALVREESAFGERVVSSSGAVGLMQLLPATADYLVRTAGSAGDPVKLDMPSDNITLGTRYLAMMIDEFKGNWARALAAYNAGPNQVRRWLARSSSRTDDEFVEEIPFTETRAYVKRVLGSYYRYRAQYSTEKDRG